MSGGSKSQVVGYRYFMGLHFGVCQGPIDALLRIIVGDRSAWQGEQTANGSITIDAPDLFGGEEREGGVQGELDVMMGGETQTPNAYLASVQGSPQPAYRGFFGAVFKRGSYAGPFGTALQSGLVSANNPYIKPWHFKVRRILAGWFGGVAWYPEKAAITFYDGFALAPDADGWLYQLSAQQPTPGYTSITPPTGGWTTGGQGPFAGGTLAGSGNTTWPVQTTLWIQRQVTVPAGEAYRLHVNAENGALIFRNGVLIGSINRDNVDVVGQETDFYFDMPGGTSTITIKAFDEFPPGGLNGTLVSCEILVPPGKGMNPAHIVYQCLTDPEWGMGYSSAIINDAGFRAAADTFHAEGMGLCLHWTQQQPIEAFIQTVMDHAGAVLRQDPRTGLFTIKPLRADYDPGTLPLFDESNIRSVENFERAGAGGDPVNEVTVRYDDSGTGKAGTVTVQNLAAVTASGGVVSQTNTYPGLPTAALAQRVAMRDLRALSTPLARVRLRVNREAYATLPGDVIRMAWPKLGIANIVLRVARVNSGALTSGEIELDCAEDVFGLGASTYVAQQPISWQPPDTSPTPTAVRRLIEAPYYELQRTLSAADLAVLAVDAGFLLIGASRPNGAALAFDVLTRPGTSGDFEQATEGDYCPSATVVEALGYTTTAATLTGVVDGDIIATGIYAAIGDEIVRVDSFNPSTGAITIGRGVLDTVATTHLAGATIVFMGEINASDNVERVDGETVEVKLLTMTGSGKVDEALAGIDTLEIQGRAARPYPPGQLRINGLAYPASASTPLEISWAHRNRLQQNLEGDETGSIGPEASTTYSVRLLAAASGSEVALATGITGTTWTATPTPTTGDYIVELWSVRSALESLQRHRYALQVLGPLSDPLWTSVVLLLRFNGADGSPTFIDSSQSAKTITRTGNAQISTTDPKFGSGCGLFDGAGDWISAPSSADFDFGSGDFTIEVWFKPLAATNALIIGKRASSTVTAPFALLYEGSSNRFSAYFDSNGTLPWGVSLVGTTGSIAVGTYYHVAVTRSGNVFRLFVNGVQQAASTVSLTLLSNASAVQIGCDADGVLPANARMDELRVTKGHARYTAAFAPPAQAFPDGGVIAEGKTLTAAASLIAGVATNGNATAPGDPTLIDARFLARASLHRGAAYNDLPASTLLLLHMDGTDGSPTFTDSSTYAHSITAARSAAITTADKIAGTGALNLPGDGVTNVDGDFLTVGTAGTRPAAFAGMFNGSDWTVEGWAKVGAAGGGIFAIGRQNPDLSFVGTLLQFRPPSFGNPPAFEIVNPAGGSAIYNGATQCPVDTWFHFAIVSTNGGQVRCYVNGVNSGSFYVGASPTPQDFVSWVLATAADMNPRVGGYSFPEPAKIDELRVLNYARYASDFTPPAPPFADP